MNINGLPGILRWDSPLFEFIFGFKTNMSLFYLFVILCLVMFTTNITANINSIPILNGSIFKSWHENLLIVLVVTDLDFVLKVNSPPPLTDESTRNDKRKIEGGKDQIACV